MSTVIPFPPRARRSFLCDGPIMLAPERRVRCALDMGADLVAENAFRDKEDAIRVLHRKGYPMFDIALLVDDAMQWAYQAVVAAAMMCESLP